MLVSEPGVGKTTLAERVADMASQAGVALVWTRCLDPNSSPAHWPWLQTLRRLPVSPAVDAALQRLEGNTEVGVGVPGNPDRRHRGRDERGGRRVRGYGFADMGRAVGFRIGKQHASHIPTATAEAAPPTASCSHSRSPCRTPDDPEKRA